MILDTKARELLFSTVRIETHSIGSGAVGTGTGFVFYEPDSKPGHELFLVSNKHVVRDGSAGYLFFTPKDSTGQPILGAPFSLRVDGFTAQWHDHPDAKIDLAVMPLSWLLDMTGQDQQEAFVIPITPEELATTELDNIDVARPIIFVGYPNGMFDHKHFTPIVRQGTVATPPELDFDDEPVFLIDASVFPGSSGSPVFSYARSYKGQIVSVSLLGVISSVYTQRTDGKIDWIPAPTHAEPVPSINQMIDLGVVLKSHLVREAIADFWQSKSGHANDATPCE